jgi:hypothetical protein
MYASIDPKDDAKRTLVLYYIGMWRHRLQLSHCRRADHQDFGIDVYGTDVSPKIVLDPQRDMAFVDNARREFRHRDDSGRARRLRAIVERRLISIRGRQ